MIDWNKGTNVLIKLSDESLKIYIYVQERGKEWYRDKSNRVPQFYTVKAFARCPWTINLAAVHKTCKKTSEQINVHRLFCQICAVRALFGGGAERELIL